MAKISTYAIDAQPELNDKVIGTDVSDSDITKNYKIGDIVSLIAANMTVPYIPVWNGTEFVNSILFQDSSSQATMVTISGLVSQTNVGESAYFGQNAGVADAFTFSHNVGIGYGALSAFTAGSFNGQAEEGVNIAIGHNALNQTTTGTNNVAIGGETLAINETGFNNVAISKNALGDLNSLNTQNNTTIGIGFSAGNQGPTSPVGLNMNGHVGGTYVGHQAFADFALSDVASVSIDGNTVLGRRAARNMGATGTKRLQTFEKNTVIGDNALISLDSTTTINDTPYRVSENIYIGRNAGANNDPGSNSIISGNVIIGKLFGGSHDIGNIVISAGSTGGKTNTLGVPGGGAIDSTIARNNIVLGSNNKIFGNNNIAINMYSDGQPSDPSQVQIGQNQNGGTAYPTTENVVLGSYAVKILEGTAEFATKNTIINSQAIKIDADGTSNTNSNLLLNSFGVSPTDPTLIQGQNNTLLNTSTFAQGAVGSLKGDYNLAIGTSDCAITGLNSDNNVIINTSVVTMQSVNNLPMTGNVVIGSSNGTLSSNLAATNSNNTRNNYVLGCSRLDLNDSGRNFIFASEFTNPTTLLNNSNNFLFGIVNNAGTQQASLTQGSSFNFLFNADDITLSGSSNIAFGQKSMTINGIDNTILNASGTITGNGNVILSGNQQIITGNNNIISGNSCETKSNTARSLSVGNAHLIGVSGAANNSVAFGTNSIIDSGANNFAFGNNINITGTVNTLAVGKNNDPIVNNTQGNSCLQVGVGSSNNNRKNALNIINTSGPLFGVVYMDQLVNQNYADDAAAAAAGILLGGLYHTDGVVKINVTP